MALQVGDMPEAEGTFHLPLELAARAAFEEADADLLQLSKSAFSSTPALDAAAVHIQRLDQEYDEMALQSDIQFGYRVKENISDLTQDGMMLDWKDNLAATYRPGRATAEEGSLAVRSLNYACSQVATDLGLSRDILGSDKPVEPDPDEVDEPMLMYERAAELPDVELGFFKPAILDGQVTIQTPAVRALLSEWKLGANPNLRPPYENPYDEAKTAERAANKQFEAYRSRIVGGMDISASQPMPAIRRETKPKPKQRIRRIEEESGPLPSQPQSQIYTQAQTQTQTQAQAPMPFSQVVPGAHGGRPTKKKRVGGF